MIIYHWVDTHWWSWSIATQSKRWWMVSTFRRNYQAVVSCRGPFASAPFPPAILTWATLHANCCCQWTMFIWWWPPWGASTTSYSKNDSPLGLYFCIAGIKVSITRGLTWIWKPVRTIRHGIVSRWALRGLLVMWRGGTSRSPRVWKSAWIRRIIHAVSLWSMAVQNWSIKRAWPGWVKET